ncbi:MAG: NIPSNAP family protein [Gammaproteobacteria bacterium]|nr:NIPSNAP family protein [Gammaproteobacteria bacterium]
MIFDHRTYTCMPGTLPRQLELYDRYGRAAQEKHLGKPIFYGIVETGPLNTYVHIWPYLDAADRSARRAALKADPEWQAFLVKNAEAGHLQSQSTMILTAAAFFEAV